MHTYFMWFHQEEEKKSILECFFEKLLAQISEFCLWKQDNKAQATYPESETYSGKKNKRTNRYFCAKKSKSIKYTLGYTKTT